MKELQPKGATADALREYGRVGGVIDHILISANDEKRPHDEFHRAAALLTLDVLRRRTDDYFARLLAQAEYRDRQRSEFFQVTVNPELLTGRPVTVDEFIGPLRDRTSNGFLTVDARSLLTADPSGYAYAFCEPPYPMSCSAAEAADLFRALTDALFGGFDEALFIYAWSTDCSTYFDAGREWWGTFFWTVEHRDSGRMVGIAASTTD